MVNVALKIFYFNATFPSVTCLIEQRRLQPRKNYHGGKTWKI